MPRFFVAPSDIQGDRFHLTGSEAHHALHVMRKKVGDTLDLFDGRDRAFTGKIEHIDSGAIAGSVLSTQPHTPPAVEIWLYAALIKGPRWDWLLQKACEVGVDVLVPLETARTVIRLQGKETTAKLDRWSKIALEAAKQCGRATTMQVRTPQLFADALRQDFPDTLRLFPWEKENQQTLRQACAGFKGKRVSLWIGPEGGWTGEEAQAAQGAGAKSVTLGKNMLRSETAGIIAAALVAQELQ